MPFDLMIGVPIDCSGAFAGCERLPAALRAAGIAEALGVPDRGDLQAAIADPVRDPAGGVIGLRDVVGAVTVVRETLAPLRAEGQRPLVLGGCCTLLIGVAAALRDADADAGLLSSTATLTATTARPRSRGRPRTWSSRSCSGVGADPLVRIAGDPPLLFDRRVVVLGPADEEDAARDGAPDPRSFAPAMPIVTSVERDDPQPDPRPRRPLQRSHRAAPFRRPRRLGELPRQNAE